MTMKVSQNRWHIRIGSRFILPYHLPVWQHNSQSSRQKIFHLKPASVMRSFPTGSRCVKNVLSGRWTRGRCTGFDVEGWAGVTEWHAFSSEGPIEIRCWSERQWSNYSNMHVIISYCDLAVVCIPENTFKPCWPSELWCFWICKNMKLFF